MKIYENGNNWAIQDQLDDKLVIEIRNVIDKNLNKFEKGKEGYSTTGENAEQYWLIKKSKNFYFKNETFENIKNDYKNNILKRLKQSNLLNMKISDLDIDNKNCWTVIGEENSFHTAHFHNNAEIFGISTILYLNVPKSNNKHLPHNNLFLIMNSEPNNPFYDNKPKIINIEPEVGKLLIFPDWIIHGTYPQTKGIRQTFNIDYHFICKDKHKTNLKYN